MDLQTAVKKILGSYGRWYNISESDKSFAPLIAKAEFHEQETGYMLVKKVRTWTADRHEYVWFYSVPHLNIGTYEECLKNTLAEGIPMVKPVKGHMSTYISNVIICDTADPEALKAVKKCRIRKEFRFSLLGWMEVQTAIAQVQNGTVAANNAGRNTAAFLEEVLDPKKKRKMHILK